MVRAYQGSRCVVIPTRLESLSLCMAEALVLSPHVIASPIPAHRELAARLGRRPTWIGGEVSAPTPPPQIDMARIQEEWDQLGEVLQLPRPQSADT